MTLIQLILFCISRLSVQISERPLIMWAERDVLQQTMPMDSGNTSLTVSDCFDIFVEMPSNCGRNSDLLIVQIS